MLEIIRSFFTDMVNRQILPEYFKYAFVINSLICTLFIGTILGGIGTMVVTKKMAFFSEAIGHAALTGIAFGILAGEPYNAPYIMLFTYCILFGLLINYTKNRTKMSADTLIGIFLSISIALGGSLLIFVSSKANFHMLENVMFGSILTVTDFDILILIVTILILTIILIPLFNKMLLSSFNTNIATVKGINVKLTEYIFIIVVTVVTIVSVKIIGAALVEALLLIPAASAKNLSRSMKGFFFYSIIFSLISCILGVLIPLHYNISIPSGGAIILTASFIFFITIIIKNVSQKFSESE